MAFGTRTISTWKVPAVRWSQYQYKDGKGMFNATQCAAFQFGNTGTESAHPQGEQSKDIGKQRSFGPSLPHDFHEIFPSGYRSNQ
jgi:hypothetical protein